MNIGTRAMVTAEEITVCTVFNKEEMPFCGEFLAGLSYWPTDDKNS